MEKSVGEGRGSLFHNTYGAPFWSRDMHEPLIVVIVLPLSFDPSYRGPWIWRGTPEAVNLAQFLEAGYQDPALHGSIQFHVLERPLPSLRDSPEGWSGNLLFKFLIEQRRFSLCTAVWCRTCILDSLESPFPIQDNLEDEKEENEENELDPPEGSPRELNFRWGTIHQYVLETYTRYPLI